MSSLELQRLAARMVSGPRDAGLYVRALEAAAVARRGLELLQEVAEMLDGPAGAARPVPARVDRLRPGDRLVLEPAPAGLDEPEEAATDLLDGAAEALSRTLASGSVHDLAANLARLTEPGLREQLADEVAGLLESLPAGDVARLREAVDRWRRAGAEPSFLARLADAMVPEPEGERGDRLRFAGDRLRDAAALLKTGKEMLQEVAGLLPGGQHAAAAEPPAGEAGEPGSFTPGSWLRVGESLVPTDPLELLGREVAAVVAPAAAGIEAIEHLLAELTRGLDDRGRPVGLLQARLESGSAGADDLARLAGALGLPPVEAGERPAVENPPQKRRATLGQLGRALERAPERFRTIEAAWEVLGSEKATFARRWAAGIHLCRLTRERVRSDPAEAAAWAARVGQVAAAFSGATGAFEERMVDFLGTFANAHVGNALRVQGHLLVAERFFLPWQEDDQLGLKAEYLALKATLRRVQRRPLEAIAMFEEADRIASRGGFPGAAELTARIRIAHAHALEMMGEIKEAAGLLRTTLGRGNPTPGAIQAMPAGELSPGLRYIALQNLADFLSKAGEFEEASQVLVEADEVGQHLDHPELDLLRAQWVRARLDARIAWHAGVDTLGAVRQRLLDLGLLHDAALASLELAQWHAEEIRGTDQDHEHVEAIRALAAESAAFSAGQDVGPEAVAAIALFQHVSTFAVPTPTVLRKIELLLRQAAVL